jgi:Fe-Mn family superoxide dismutase
MLEPAIDARTMQIHHGRHHKAYVDNLNKALAKHPELIGRSLRDLLSNLDTLPEDIREDVRNNGGGHMNHHLFWEILTPGRTAPEPAGELREALNRDLGGYEALKDEFIKQSLALFGSGWVFLQVNSTSGKLEVASYPNQDCPLMQRHEPLFGLDLWEHAYYLNYRNRRREYVDAFWTLVNWDKVMDMHGGEQIKL